MLDSVIRPAWRRKFATDGTPASTAWWNGLWQYGVPAPSGVWTARYGKRSQAEGERRAAEAAAAAEDGAAARPA